MSKKPANNLFKDKTNVYVTECLSTNDFLIQLLSKNKLEEGSVVLADFQTKGKGQRNNSWSSNLTVCPLLILYSISATPIFDSTIP